jgi:hypothetical protein
MNASPTTTIRANAARTTVSSISNAVTTSSTANGVSNALLSFRLSYQALDGSQFSTDQFTHVLVALQSVFLDIISSSGSVSANYSLVNGGVSTHVDMISLPTLPNGQQAYCAVQSRIQDRSFANMLKSEDAAYFSNVTVLLQADSDCTDCVCPPVAALAPSTASKSLVSIVVPITCAVVIVTALAVLVVKMRMNRKNRHKFELLSYV